MDIFLQLVTAVVSLVVVALIFWWIVPIRQSRALRRLLNEKDENKKPDELELAKLENENRRTITQLLAGFFVLISIPFTVYQLILNADALKAERDEKARASGMELLGKEAIYERLDGISKLREWAQKAEIYEIRKIRHDLLKEQLISFVKGRTQIKALPSELSSECGQWAPYLPTKPEGHSVDPDVQAALDYLRINSNIEYLDFRGLDLTGANLTGLKVDYAVFARSDLGYANLSETKFGRADFYCVNLFRANLRGTEVNSEPQKCANVSKPSDKGFANFTGIYAGFADFKGAKLDNAYFKDANLSDVTFISANTRGSCFLRANLNGVNLDDVDGDFTDACVFNSKNLSRDNKKFEHSVREDPDKRPDADKRSNPEYGSWCKPPKNLTLEKPGLQERDKGNR